MDKGLMIDLIDHLEIDRVGGFLPSLERPFSCPFSLYEAVSISGSGRCLPLGGSADPHGVIHRLTGDPAAGGAVPAEPATVAKLGSG